MRRIIISHSHQARAENAAKTQRKPFGKHKKRRTLKCGKCGKILALGSVAYTTQRKFLCQDCGEKVEIEA